MYNIGAGLKGKSPMNWGKYIYSPGHFPKPFYFDVELDELIEVMLL